MRRRRVWARTRPPSGSGPGIAWTARWWAPIQMINGFKCRQDGHETSRMVMRSLEEGTLGPPNS
ncbi:MAG TPA: hypothetical protein VFT38_14090 [Vicinamibacteria bacterium]|nr:hypothetical protein [Vicinamibacteria bacterium]